MKNAHLQHSEVSGQATGHYKPRAGLFLRSFGSVRSQVLVDLILGKTLGAIDAVFVANTTRLAAVIHVLQNMYGWQIERKEIAVGTNDGRVARVSQYWMRAEIREAALAFGGRDFVGHVTGARKVQRTKAPACRVRAFGINALRSKSIDPRQLNLLGGGHV